MFNISAKINILHYNPKFLKISTNYIFLNATCKIIYIVYSPPMENFKKESLSSLLKTPKNIAIIPHKSPDGDAMGSSLGLWHYLIGLGHNAKVISPNAYADFLAWLPGNPEVIQFEENKEEAGNLIAAADVIFTLDFNTLSRAGDLSPFLKESKAHFVMIDHHQQPDDYADTMYSDPNCSSTCELVYHFIMEDSLGQGINQEIATCLYTGIMTDTGSFKFASTSSNTHRVIADLIDRGAESSKIYQSVFDTYTLNRLHLLGTALKNLKLIPHLNTAYITLSQSELDKYDFTKGDTEGFVNYGLSIKGVIFAAIFIENKEDKIVKVSLRSKGDFNVNHFSRNHFGGGGHVNAAGGISHKSLKETQVYFESLLPDYEKELREYE